MGQRKSGHVTLLDIARTSGFSVSTVSIVLSEAPLSQNVAATTREHIRTIAQQLGYHPDAYARSLRRRSTQTIGVLAFDLSDPFCTPILRGIQGGLRSAGYLPLIVDAQAQRKLFDSSLHMILERRADGVIVIASWVFEETNLLGDVKKNNVPVVIIGRDLAARGIDSILVDNEAGRSHRRAAPERSWPPAHRGHSRAAGDGGQRAALGWDSASGCGGGTRDRSEPGVPAYPASPIPLPASKAVWRLRRRCWPPAVRLPR